MKIFASVRVPKRTSYDTVKDVKFTKELYADYTIADIIKWARNILDAEAHEGPGSNNNPAGNADGFYALELSIDR